MALTLAGKILIGIALVCVIYFAIFVIPAMFAGKTGITIIGRSKVKLIAFVKTSDEESATLNKILAELANDPTLKNIFTYEIVVVDVEKAKAEKFAVTEKDVPCLIIGNEKVVGTKNKSWLRKKILSVAKQSGIKGA